MSSHKNKKIFASRFSVHKFCDLLNCFFFFGKLISSAIKTINSKGKNHEIRARTHHTSIGNMIENNFSLQQNVTSIEWHNVYDVIIVFDILTIRDFIHNILHD